MTKTLSVRLDDARWRQLEATAATRGISASEVIRDLVDTLESPRKTWDEILAPVRARAAQIQAKDRRSNPVLAARRKRRFHERLR